MTFLLKFSLFINFLGQTYLNTSFFRIIVAIQMKDLDELIYFKFYVRLDTKGKISNFYEF